MEICDADRLDCRPGTDYPAFSGRPGMPDLPDFFESRWSRLESHRGRFCILDPWWNVAAENQAVSRAHRIGQKRAVFVYRFITAGTLEEKILAIQERKQRLADSVITAATSIPLTDEELLEVL